MTADSLVAETATTTAELKESSGASNLLSSFKIGMEWANFPVQQEAASAQSGSSEMEKGTTGALHGFLGGVKGGFQAGLDGFRGAVDSSSSRLANFSSSLSARPSMPDASSWPSKKAQSEQDDAGAAEKARSSWGAGLMTGLGDVGGSLKSLGDNIAGGIQNVGGGLKDFGGNLSGGLKQVGGNLSEGLQGVVPTGAWLAQAPDSTEEGEAVKVRAHSERWAGADGSLPDGPARPWSEGAAGVRRVLQGLPHKGEPSFSPLDAASWRLVQALRAESRPRGEWAARGDVERAAAEVRSGAVRKADRGKERRADRAFWGEACENSSDSESDSDDEAPGNAQGQEANSILTLPRVGLQLEAGELSASNGERSPWAETPTSVASESRLLRRKLGLETFGEDSFPGTFEVDDDVDESSGPSTPHVEATPIRTAFSKRSETPARVEKPPKRFSLGSAVKIGRAPAITGRVSE